MWLESAGLLDNKKYENLLKMSGNPHVKVPDIKTLSSRGLVTSRDSLIVKNLVRCYEVAATITMRETAVCLPQCDKICRLIPISNKFKSYPTDTNSHKTTQLS